MLATKSRFASKVFLCLALLTSGCSDPGTPLDPEAALIVGSWVWQRSVGGFAGQVILPQPGVGTVDTFTPYGQYSRVVNGTLSLSARYDLRREGEYLMVVYNDIDGGYPDMHLFNQLITVEGDTLHLTDYGADLYRHTYARLR